MSRLTEEIEDLEDQLREARSKVLSMKDEIYDLRDQRDDMYDELKQLRAYVEWFEATYPDAAIAYQVAQRVST